MDKRYEITQLIDGYYAWLRENTTVKVALNDWFEIETPVLDRHNDCMVIYAKKMDSEILLSDGGYILDDLCISGFDVSSSRRSSLINQVANSFGVRIENGEILTSANASDFNTKKHMLIQAMLAINDLFYLVSPTSVSVFADEVMSWFTENNIRMIDNCQFTGKSGFLHHFDFAIPSSPKSRLPVRLVDVINTPNKQNIQNTIFKWMDTKDTRHTPTTLYAIINDANIHKPSMAEPLKNYGIKSILWSRIDEFQKELIA